MYINALPFLKCFQKPGQWRKALRETHRHSGCRVRSCSPSAGTAGRPTPAVTLPGTRPAPRRAISASQRPRRTPPRSYRSFPGQARPFHFPAFRSPSSDRNPHRPTRSLPCLPCEPRPAERGIPSAPAFLPHPPFWATRRSWAGPSVEGGRGQGGASRVLLRKGREGRG